MNKSLITAVLLIAVVAALAVLPVDLAAVLSPHVATVLTQPSVAMAALAVSATAAEPLAYTIKNFCRAHNISIPTYYDLKKQGLGPAEMRMGGVIRISREAAAAWRQARENPDEAEASENARTTEALRSRARHAAKRSIASSSHISARRRAGTVT
jgi:hypothetical protein